MKTRYSLQRLFVVISAIFCIVQLDFEGTVLAKNSSASIDADRTITIPSVKKIRVLLEEKNVNKESRFIIKARHSFVLEGPIDSGQTALYNEKEIFLLCKKKQLFLKCYDREHDTAQYRRIKYNNVEICDPNHKLTLGSKTYQGSLIFRIDPTTNTLLVINRVPLEDYVYSVVRNECIPSWPLGMQKIQAIISRTYAVYLMQQARLKNPRFCFYDIKNTNLHQVYNGMHNYTHLRQAVDETQNLILTYKNHIALTMFDICCGGVIPGLMRGKDASAPYLYRTQRCTYCHESPSYRWKEDMHIDKFMKSLKNVPRLSSRFKSFKGSLLDAKITDRDKAEIVQKIKFFDKRHNTFAFTGNDIRGAFPNQIKSACFTVKKIRDRIVISGKGYGHQKGVCQWGCKNLVEKGWSLKRILSFYYPGTKLSRLL